MRARAPTPHPATCTDSARPDIGRTKTPSGGASRGVDVVRRDPARARPLSTRCRARTAQACRARPSPHRRRPSGGARRDLECFSHAAPRVPAPGAPAWSWVPQAEPPVGSRAGDRLRVYIQVRPTRTEGSCPPGHRPVRAVGPAGPRRGPSPRQLRCDGRRRADPSSAPRTSVTGRAASLASPAGVPGGRRVARQEWGARAGPGACLLLPPRSLALPAWQQAAALPEPSEAGTAGRYAPRGPLRQAAGPRSRPRPRVSSRHRSWELCRNGSERSH